MRKSQKECEKCDTLAEKFATALVAGTNLNPVGINQEELFGSLLFEYQAPDPDEPDNPAKKCHIIIILNNSQSPTIQLAEKAYDWLRNLLCFHHKILFIDHEARQRYQEARAIYSYLEKKIQEFNKLISKTQTQLSDFKKILAEIPQKSLDYTRCLQDLQREHLTFAKTSSSKLTIEVSRSKV